MSRSEGRIRVSGSIVECMAIATSYRRRPVPKQLTDIVPNRAWSPAFAGVTLSGAKRLRWNVLSIACVAGFLGACSASEPGATGLSAGAFPVGSVTSYVAANAILTQGHSEVEIEPGQFRVKAKGSAVTPPARLEKIAMARAAEIGVEQNKKFFKPGTFVHTVACEDARDLPNKSGKLPAVRSPVVVLDVVYAKDAAGDPAFQSAADTFARVSAEIAGETVSPEAKAAASAAILAKCGK